MVIVFREISVLSLHDVRHLQHTLWSVMFGSKEQVFQGNLEGWEKIKPASFFFLGFSIFKLHQKISLEQSSG